MSCRKAFDLCAMAATKITNLGKRIDGVARRPSLTHTQSRSTTRTFTCNAARHS